MKRNKSKSSQYLIPYIDFAFMVIIIFIALLSIAYFEPPGEGTAGDKEIEKKIDKKEIESTIEKINNKIPTLISSKKQENILALKQKIKNQEDKIKEMALQLSQKEEEIKKLQDEIRLLEEEIKNLKEHLSTQYQGRHEFTNLKQENTSPETP